MAKKVADLLVDVLLEAGVQRVCGDRVCGWNRGTKDGVAPKLHEGELRQLVLKTQWTPAYTELQ